MPTLNLTTNVPHSGLDTSELLSVLSKTVASSVGKPEDYVMVSVTADKPMCFAGTEAPCAFAELFSIGGIGGAKNATISAAIAAVLETKLGIPKSRFYLKFTDVEASDYGWNGSTF